MLIVNIISMITLIGYSYYASHLKSSIAEIPFDVNKQNNSDWKGRLEVTYFSLCPKQMQLERQMRMLGFLLVQFQLRLEVS